MLQSVIDYIDKYNMINKGDKIIVAVSGGPDSMCLLHMLLSIKDRYSLQLVAAHINHGLRGVEADKDEEYVEKFCVKEGIEFFSKHVDVHKLSSEKGMSCELAGREVRYKFFDYLLIKLKAQKIALAHNANDSAETVLMRIIRGTGSDGLIGIKPVRDRKYIRPILNLSRKQIEYYCEMNNLNPRIDKSNLENIYSRNKIRLELIPYIEKNFNPNIIDTINKFSEIVTMDNNYIEEITIKKFNNHCKIHKEKVIIQKEAFIENEAILSRIIRKSIEAIAGDLCNFEKVHIHDIISLQKQGTGKLIRLPRNLEAYNNYGSIEIRTKEAYEFNIKYEYQLNLNSTIFIKENNISIAAKIIDNDKNLKLCDMKNIKYFDYNKVSFPIILRNRRDGDKFNPSGMKGSKKLKDYFMDIKVPKEMRNKIPLLVFNKDIAWVIGYRISNKFKINNNTKKILEIRIEGEDKRNEK